MAQFIQFFFFVTFAFISCEAALIRSPFALLANETVQFIQNHRQELADGYQGLPPLDPVNIPEPFELTDGGYTAVISNTVISGFTEFNNLYLTILDNGVFCLLFDIPEVSMQGHFDVPMLGWSSNGFRASLSDVQLIITGLLNRDKSDALTLNQVNANVNVNGNIQVKVTGLPNNLFNKFVTDLLTSKLAEFINNHSGVYNAALSETINDFGNELFQGHTFSQIANFLNSAA